jgi:hypothetical protein
MLTCHSHSHPYATEIFATRHVRNACLQQQLEKLGEAFISTLSIH